MKLTGNEIRDLRWTAGVTQLRFAIHLHVTETIVGNWESGKTTPIPADMEKLLRFEKELARNPDFLKDTTPRRSQSTDSDTSAVRFPVQERTPRDRRTALFLPVYPFSTMKVGDIFEIPCEANDRAKWHNRLKVAANYRRKHVDPTFYISVRQSALGLKVWRVQQKGKEAAS